MSDTLASLSDVKTRLNISDASDDARLTSVIEGASGMIVRAISRSMFREVDRVEYHDGGWGRIVLDLAPLETLTEVVESSDRDWDNETPLVEDEDFVIEQEGQVAVVLIRLNRRWLSGRKAVRAKYTGGYLPAGQTPSAAEIPVDEALREACIQQTVHNWKNRESPGVLSLNAGGGSVQVVDRALLKSVEAVVNDFRRVRLC